MVKSAIGYPCQGSLPRADQLWRGRRAAHFCPWQDGASGYAFGPEVKMVLPVSWPPSAGEAAVPITPVTRDGARRPAAGAGRRGRAHGPRPPASAAEPGKVGLLPGRERAAGPRAGRRGPDDPLWTLAACPDALPEGTYALDAASAGRRRRPGGARLGARHLCLHPLQTRSAASRSGRGRRRRPRRGRGGGAASSWRATSSTRRPRIWARRACRRRRRHGGAACRALPDHPRRRAPRRELPDDPRRRPRQHARAAPDRSRLGPRARPR